MMIRVKEEEEEEERERGGGYVGARGGVHMLAGRALLLLGFLVLCAYIGCES
jgi:hypothetical protein